jgi:hypothetical protein
MTRTLHRLALSQGVPVDPPALAMGAEGVKDAALVVALLAVRAEELFLCIKDWSAFHHSHHPSHVVDAQLTGVREGGPKNAS